MKSLFLTRFVFLCYHIGISLFYGSGVQRRRSFTSDTVAAEYQQHLQHQERFDAEFFYRVNSYFQRKPEYRRLLDHLMKQYVEPNLFYDEQKRIFMCQLQYAPPKGLMFDLFVPIEWLQANVSSANDSGAESVISYIDLDDENAITGEIGKLLKIFSDLHAVDGRQIYLNQLVQQLKNSMRERRLIH
jgi:hypothetical protein